MRKPIFVRQLSSTEREALTNGLRSSDAFTMRRCQILLASAAGQRAPEIARNLHCNDQTVRNALQAFNARGLAALSPGSSRPKTIHRAFDDAGVEQLRALLHKSPRLFDKPTSLWTLDLAAAVAFEQGLTSTLVSGETIRATLKQRKISWRRAKHWITSPDPEYVAKKRDATD